MATWTHLKNTSILTADLRHVASSGTKLYYVDNVSSDVYEWDPDTNTETRIVDASAITDYDITYAIAWFNGDLYVMNAYAGDAPRVERWDGTPDDLTTVKSFTVVNGGPTQIGMIADESIITAFSVENPVSPAPYSAEGWYSSDGSSWSAASWSNDVWSPPDLNGAFDAPKNTAFPLGLYREFVTATNGARTTTTEKRIFKFVGGVWTQGAILNTNPNEIYRHSSPNENIHFTYTAGQYYDLNFAGTNTIPSSPPQMYQINMPFGVALDFAPNILYELSGGAWSALDTFDITWDIEPSTSPVIVKMNDGNAYIIAYSSIGAGYDVRIFGRDEPLGCAAAQFYYGIEVPEYASDLPFCGVEPGALAIAALTGLVILGSNAQTAGGPMVVWGQYPYTGGWTDITGIVPEDIAVSSIKFL